MYIEGWRAWALIAVAAAATAWALMATLALQGASAEATHWELSYYQLATQYARLLEAYNEDYMACSSALNYTAMVLGEASRALNYTEYVLMQASLALNYTTNQLGTVEEALNYTASVLNYTATVLNRTDAVLLRSANATG